jgi:hypothetical protein
MAGKPSLAVGHELLWKLILLLELDKSWELNSINNYLNAAEPFGHLISSLETYLNIEK